MLRRQHLHDPRTVDTVGGGRRVLARPDQVAHGGFRDGGCIQFFAPSFRYVEEFVSISLFTPQHLNGFLFFLKFGGGGRLIWHSFSEGWLANRSKGGAIMSGHSEASLHLGEKIVIGGLFVQIVFFGLFVITSVVFHYRILHNPTACSELLRSAARAKRWETRWETLLVVLYVTSTFILVRSVFRAIEYIQGNDGLFLRNEVWLYCFDSVLMLAVMGCFNAVHPSGIVPGRRKEEIEIVEMEVRGRLGRVEGNEAAKKGGG
jgi:hypothetical protein